MPRKTAKEKKKTTRKANNGPTKKGAAKGKEAPPSRRLHETFGITTLAAAMLLGPSLVSVQFGDGDLMGPLGQVVGSSLNWLIGLTGYLFIGALVVVAMRIFAFGLGLQSDNPPINSLWRERGGMMLGVICAAMMLHLIARPARISGASAGGFLGEVIAEVICSVVSTPGAWVVAFTGLALSILLSTSLSWARAGVWLWTNLRAGALALGQGTAAAAVAALDTLYELRLASIDRLHALYERFIASTAVHQEVDADGAVALPPVIRLDLGEEEGGKKRRRTRKKKPQAKAKAAAEPLPVDLEIGQSDEPEAEPEVPMITETPKIEMDAKGDPTEVDLVKVDKGEKTEKKEEKDSATTTAAVSSKDDTEKDALTIVESKFEKKLEAAAEEQEVEQTDSPGFELKGDTYKPPPLDLLKFDENAETNVDKEAIYRRADRLVRTLADYKIQGRITEVHPGPVITMYEFVPAPGTRISKVANLANDLAMSLAAQKVRIVAPIPGKRAIGIEVPNDKSETVFFKEIVGNQAFSKGKARLPLALGKNTEGAPVVMDLAKMPHLLVAGATGMGKSVSINVMICSLLMRHTPEEVRLIMVDPKFLELSGYNDIPHLMLPVVTDPKQANVALRWAVNEMERRYQLLADMRVREIASYNKKVDKIRDEALAVGVAMDAEDIATEREINEGPNAETIEEATPAQVMVMRRNADGSEEQVMADVVDATKAADPVAEAEAQAATPPAPPRRRRRKDKNDPDKHPRTGEALPRRLPFIVVVIDEFADLMMVASKEVETSVARLAQKARAAGIHVILATQRPSVDVITGLIKANFPSRVSFAVASPHDSKTILGSQGAENLLGNGDMLVMDRGMATKRLHGAYISDDEIQSIVDWLKEQGRPVYDMDILKCDDEDEDGGVEDEPVDAMYDLAVTFVSDTRRCSISSIQRRLRVGYNRAARMVEMMERDGVVGPPDRKNNREVLIRSHDGGPM